MRQQKDHLHHNDVSSQVLTSGHFALRLRVVEFRNRPIENLRQVASVFILLHLMDAFESFQRFVTPCSSEVMQLKQEGQQCRRAGIKNTSYSRAV